MSGLNKPTTPLLPTCAVGLPLPQTCIGTLDQNIKLRNLLPAQAGGWETSWRSEVTPLCLLYIQRPGARDQGCSSLLTEREVDSDFCSATHILVYYMAGGTGPYACRTTFPC
ncbi:hypothetical protein ASPFODRAFT_68604 [Aspergillus luchuensis CBS 106.47]|uniref:Uncharacterized protein n=1 Tax=Aspergillus luchuensis (strain CBS 106.47) TaxID=1137211 RepID=A0A1M3TQP6_ASPLC|nr:hypothetical protein ASPFODRAFT_68604 [Aspergillus luchuensis CBS 106.47]